ncbi:plastocyanin/azurin family copper-binding protein [Dyadobacter sp. CY343]|uniref:plastocyanin/azurin family copper-binding protein n=1 Tax=Dyadobacter sp. CY343 TaxID=2907299 RepID=UPI001F43F9C5|nr:plastocyanin/azurin family copper-binding protein [Dyadobacter sp. CY343]MCE7060428.1 plastocyanin/azurin family copper-binding protein [Dyadobacter sp. CY343]
MKNILLTTLISLGCLSAYSQSKPNKEDDFYRIVTIPIPENIKMEVGGMQVLPDGRLATSTRRGEVWMIGNPYLKGDGKPSFHKFATGLHEPLGLLYRGKDFLISQRGEVTRLADTDNDGIADVYDSFAKWPLSGNYHQYSYGPVAMPNGELLVTLNLDWVGRGASGSKWRGWMLKLGEDGKLTPYATGLRSPSGFGSYKGDIFYTENQGDWVGSGRMTHLEKGDFAGNPAGLKWGKEEGSPVKITAAEVPNTGEPLYDVAKKVPGIKPPAVWFPHTLVGISTSDFKEDVTNGAFGPFTGQMFVGDQGHSIITRVDLEKVNGVWQGTVFPFREGFMSGILRMEWGLDGSMFVGQTSRGWSATGKSEFGIQRLVWTGKMPFEMKTVRSTPDGFEITFTSPIDKAAAASQDAYKLNSFTYKYHSTYGSPIINTQEVPLKGIIVSEDGMRVRLVVDPATLRKGYIHEIKADGVKGADGNALLHTTGYYTLNEIPAGNPASSAQFTTTVKATPVDHSAHNMSATETNATNTAASAKRVTEMPASWTKGPDQTITIGTVPGLKFDISEIQVKAGSRVRIVFNNNDDMLHNLVITKPGTANAVGEAGLNLGLKGSEMSYVPKTNDVLFHSNIVEPEKSESIFFVAPKQAGTYQYVCTFPGHYTMMQGKMKVVK